VLADCGSRCTEGIVGPATWPGKTKGGKNYAKGPEQLEAVETGQQGQCLQVFLAGV